VKVPEGLLIVALACLFLFQNGRNSFLPGHHGYLSSHGLSIAANLSARHHFLMFNVARLQADGSTSLEAYNRFPPGAFLAIHGVTRPVAGSLELQIFAAHQLMNVFFAAACLAGFLAIRRLVANGWIALGATLLGFSGYYCLYYNDMVFNDVPALFGVMLVLHGLVVFVQEDAPGQLLARIAVALLLGWQVYALIGAFLLVSLAGMVYKRRFDAVAVRRLAGIGAFAGAFGLALLALNLANELSALGGTLAELPTVRSALWYLGMTGRDVDTPFPTQLTCGDFVHEQLYRIGRMCVPYCVAPIDQHPIEHAWLGLAVLIFTLAAAAASRHRVLALSLALSGLCWAVAVRRFVQLHDFQTIFYTGLSVSFWCALLSLGSRAWSRFPVLAGCAAVAVFGLSSARLNLVKSAGAEEENLVTADFQRIADRVGVGRSVYVLGPVDRIGGAQHAVSFYLSGNCLDARPESADYCISDRKLEALPSFTPANHRVFLYAGGKVPVALATLRAEIAPAAQLAR
jgi:hypothetical protein